MTRRGSHLVVLGTYLLAAEAGAQTIERGLTGAAGDGAEIAVYDREPVRIRLPVGQERIVTFPEPVQLGLSPTLARKLRAQVVEDTAYLKAAEPFALADESRALAVGVASGRAYVLDLEAAPGSSAGTMAIRGADAPDPSTASEAAPPPALPPAYGFVRLTQMAARQIHAPERLADRLPGVVRLPLQGAQPTTALPRGGALSAIPVASWQASEGLYVTALRVTNRLGQAVPWDPRLLRGAWLAATAHHQVLGPAGDPTAVYPISERPFAEAASPWHR